MPELSPEEAAHARSILDPEPTLKPTPPERITRILVGVPVRKPPEVLQQLIATLAWQRLRVPVDLTFLFTPNFGAEPFRDAALALLQAAPLPHVLVWPNEVAPEGDYGERAETRQWSPAAFGRMAALKNRILQYALDQHFDFVWLLDADVLCDPGTLQSLLDSANHERWRLNENVALPIVSGVYWTRWQRPNADSAQAVHAGPQVWLTHPYGLQGRGWTEGQFRRALVKRGRLTVGGLGACTLIPVGVLRHGVSFAHHEGLAPGPMSEGEDRHFCAWATEKHVQLVADAWPDIYHAYHPQEYAALDARVAALRYESASPAFGWLVSGKIEMLEPMPDGVGRMFMGMVQWVRGRLGALPVLPQIEETLAGLAPGQTKLLKLHFPLDYPEVHLRLKSVVTRVTLCDAKPWHLPPVIDEEYFVGEHSGALLDTTQHRTEQLDALATP